jgi:5-methylcytosine-specific restriction enzyme subunit McrC
MEMNDNILNMELDVIMDNEREKNLLPLPKKTSSKEPIVIQEHAYIPEDYYDRLQSVNFVGNPTEYMGTPKFLGIGQDFRASYYIGASWLIENELAVVVTPKKKDNDTNLYETDFVKMFVAALEVDTKYESDYFSDCYRIAFGEPTIETNENLTLLTPMLVLHYISLLSRLVKRGLKKDYITREENLKAKVKGRIMMGRHLQKNVFQQRADLVFCQYQEYTDNTPENRLLKRALLFAEMIIDNYESLKKQLDKTDVPRQLSTLKSRFSHISDDIEPYQIQHLSANKLYKDYREAIRVARMLLRRFDYSISAVSDEYQSTPPFWIDMSRLYEMWVLSKLNVAFPGQIKFQVDGHCRTKVDYIKKDEKIIMDAKYKPHYEDSNRGILDDIREISGYARDKKILKRLDADEQEVKCVIIYPKPISLQSNGTDTDTDDTCKKIDYFEKGELIPQCSEINWFRNFYKISVQLPKM